MRTDWISESIVAEWNRRDTGKTDRVLTQDKGIVRGGLVNKGPDVSSVDKELAAEGNGTGVPHLGLALEGSKDNDKNKTNKNKEFGRLTSFKRGKDVGRASYFSDKRRNKLPKVVGQP